MTSTSKPESVRFVYFRDAVRHPVGVMAYVVDRDKHTVTYAHSSWVAADSFNRKRGREIAVARLKKSPHAFKFDPTQASNVGEIVEQVFDNLEESTATIRKALRVRASQQKKRAVVKSLLQKAGVGCQPEEAKELSVLVNKLLVLASV